MDSTHSVQQAAAHFGVSEKTIRRRIAAGELYAFKVPTAQGYEWRIQVDTDAVHLPGDAVQLDAQPVQEPGQPAIHVDTEQNAALLRALDMVDELRRENVQLAGQVGYLQRQAFELQEQVRMLTVEKEPDEEQHPPQPEPPSEPRSPLWQWVRRRLWRA